MLAVFLKGLQNLILRGTVPGREPCPQTSVVFLFRKAHLGAGPERTAHLPVSYPLQALCVCLGSAGSREKEGPQHPLGVEGSRGADLFSSRLLATSLISTGGTGREAEARGNHWEKTEIPECW